MYIRVKACGVVGSLALMTHVNTDVEKLICLLSVKFSIGKEIVDLCLDRKRKIHNYK